MDMRQRLGNGILPRHGINGHAYTGRLAANGQVAGLGYIEGVSYITCLAFGWDGLLG
jgi:hypothetical protein